ncbi:winged helix domain-containing protein [Yunchengibacter salinarum]|uniref:winged helix domain-containing protein n=1 Tax=Yunchengibacter salinarum TaxID=3133399 RepID=UPI0035B65F04
MYPKSRTYTIIPADGGPAFTVALKGRTAWALDQLIQAGPRGLTTLENPAPRWSAYVHNLRAVGLTIATRYEPHGGPYPGQHGRYILKDRAAPVEVAA